MLRSGVRMHIERRNNAGESSSVHEVPDANAQRQRGPTSWHCKVGREAVALSRKHDEVLFVLMYSARNQVVCDTSIAAYDRDGRSNGSTKIVWIVGDNDRMGRVAVVTKANERWN